MLYAYLYYLEISLSCLLWDPARHNGQKKCGELYSYFVTNGTAYDNSKSNMIKCILYLKEKHAQSKYHLIVIENG